VPVVIDGNNLLYAARASGTTELLVGRAMLCDRVGEWAEQRQERVRIVFDGPAPNPALARQIAHRAIEVIYSGAGVSADTVLTQMLDTDSAARRVVVVSSDRAVQHAARRRRARSVRSEDFWARLVRDLARPPPPAPVEPEEKEAGLSPEATEEWLDEFGLQ
jgi:predicted RNA-binding protein with PIN domain